MQFLKDGVQTVNRQEMLSFIGLRMLNLDSEPERLCFYLQTFVLYIVD